MDVAFTFDVDGSMVYNDPEKGLVFTCNDCNGRRG